MSHRIFISLVLLLPAVSSGSLRAQSAAPQNDDVIRRFEYFYSQRKFPFDKIPAHGRRIETLAQWQSRTAFASSANSPNSVTPWTSIGPAPTISGGDNNSGRVTSVAVDPANSQVIYVGGAQGGVWKTTNGGTSWTPLTDTQCSLAIGALAIDPLNSNIIYAGTGELNFSSDSYYGCGILKSTNGGASWTTLGSSIWDTNTGGATFSRIRVVPSATDVSSSSIVLAGTNVGFYRSTDAGATWTVTLRVGHGDITDIVVDPSNRSNVYAAAATIIASGTNGVYKSTDGGVTFTKLSGFPNSIIVGRIALGNSAAAPSTVYAAVQNTDNYDSVAFYKTTNGGTTWSTLAATGAICAPRCWYDLGLTVNPSNASDVYFSGYSLYRSTNGGSTFTDVGSAVHPDHHAFAFDVATPNAILAGSDGGIYRSTNNGSTWTSLNTNLSLTQFYPGISFSTTGPLRVIGGTSGNGTPQYTGSLSWPDQIGKEGGFTATNPTTNVSFGEMQWGKNFSGPRRSDLGYAQVISGINLADGALFIPPLVMNNAQPATLYFGTTKLYKTTNSGGSWNSINTPGFTISAIGPAEFDTGTVYIGGSNGSLQVTTDGGATWATRTTGLPIRYITDFAVHRSNSQIAYVSVSGFASGHVFKTTNGGVQWNDVSGNLPDMPVNSLVLLPGGELDVGTDLGVYRSSDDGATWTVFGSGLPALAVDDLAFNPNSNTLYAATHGRGMYQSTVTVQTPGTMTAINRQPGGAAPNTPFSVQPSVSIRSAAGDLATGATNSVTAAIATGTGTLGGTTTVAAVNGVANFTNLSIDRQGTGFSLIFTSSGLVSSTSSTFTVGGVLRGDINLDGSVTAADAQEMLQAVIGIALPAGHNAIPNGDANCSGTAQVIDAQIILKKVVGADVSAYCVNTVQ